MLASGTFGTVYRARDETLARDVALKILHVPAIGEGLAMDAVSEGRLLARVRHPHVVSVYGADQYDGRVGLWMELIQGRTLEDELSVRGPLPVAEVLAIGAGLAQALHAVHAAGLLHRDLKTQNVMCAARDGRVVLMDFSAGRDQVDDGPPGARPATIAGSPLDIAPEVLAGGSASARSDISSLGVVLFRLLSARFSVEERRWPRSNGRTVTVPRSCSSGRGPTCLPVCRASCRAHCTRTRPSATRRATRWIVISAPFARQGPRADDAP